MILDIDNIPSPLLTEKFSAVLAGQCYWLAAISEDSFFSKRRQRHLHSEYFICLQSQLGEGGVLSFLSLSAPVIVFSLKYVSHGMSEGVNDR